MTGAWGPIWLLLGCAGFVGFGVLAVWVAMENPPGQRLRPCILLGVVAVACFVVPLALVLHQLDARRDACHNRGGVVVRGGDCIKAAVIDLG